MRTFKLLGDGRIEVTTTDSAGREVTEVVNGDDMNRIYFQSCTASRYRKPSIKKRGAELVR